MKSPYQSCPTVPVIAGHGTRTDGQSSNKKYYQKPEGQELS